MRRQHGMFRSIGLRDHIVARQEVSVSLLSLWAKSMLLPFKWNHRGRSFAEFNFFFRILLKQEALFDERGGDCFSDHYCIRNEYRKSVKGYGMRVPYKHSTLGSGERITLIVCIIKYPSIINISWQKTYHASKQRSPGVSPLRVRTLFNREF